MKLKYSIRFLIILFLLYAIGWPVVHTKAVGMEGSGETVGSVESNQNDTPVNKDGTARDANKAGSGKVIVYYFHGTKRCWTCKRIQALTEDTIKGSFHTELQKGILELSFVNVDRPQNKHFINDYKLYTKSVVIVKISDGKQTRWKNLERIWQLVHDEEAFIGYIHEEVKAYLTGD